MCQKNTPRLSGEFAPQAGCVICCMIQCFLSLLLAVPAVGAELAFIQAGSFDQIVQAVEA